jgi:hypothetical protein
MMTSNGRDPIAELSARLHIPLAILAVFEVRHASDLEIRELLGINGRTGQDLSGIVFPCRDPRDGRLLGHRVRLDVPVDGQKYLSEKACRWLFVVSMERDALTDTSIPALIFESEKSALAFLALGERHKRRYLTVSTGGVWGWKRRSGTELQPDGGRESISGPSPSLDWIAWEGRKVVINFDSNVAGRKDLEKARLELARELSRRGARVFIASTPSRKNVNGPDDLIAEGGDGAALEMLDAAGRFVHKSSDRPACQRHDRGTETTPQSPEPAQVGSCELLEAPAAEAPKQSERQKTTQSSAGGKIAPRKVGDFLALAGIEHGAPVWSNEGNGGWKWALKRCWFDKSHTTTNPMVTLTAEGVLGYRCSHKSCAENNSAKFRDAVEPKLRYKSQFVDGAPSRTTNPWTRAVGMEELLSGEDESVDFLHNRMIVKGAITEIFSPRGLGKSLWAVYVAVLLALKGLRVLLIDRDNPRRTVRERLRAFGATVKLTTLKFLSRENAPPLTDDDAWAEFPYLEYDVIILDSLDSAAEGVGEQDSSKPSKAIAPLLDIARREDGPAVLVLGNCVRTAARSRGSGVVEDRADIVFEVRDATDFHPSGTKPWIEELPAGGADFWAARSSRRKRREKYRLAFIATKFRIGEEPDPFVLELDLTTDTWTVRDVTNAVDAEGCAVREQREKEHAEAINRARASLVAELVRRQEAQEPIMLKEKDAVPFLLKSGLKRNAARQLLEDPRGAWECRNIEGPKGHPIGVFLPSRPGEKSNGGGNTTPQKPAKNADLFDADFGRPHPEHLAEIPPSHPIENKSVATQPISAATTKVTSSEQASANASHEGDLNTKDRSNASGSEDALEL